MNTYRNVQILVLILRILTVQECADTSLNTENTYCMYRNLQILVLILRTYSTFRKVHTESSLTAAPVIRISQLHIAG